MDSADLGIKRDNSCFRMLAASTSVIINDQVII